MKGLHIGRELVWVKFPQGDRWHRLHAEQAGQTACCGRDVNLWEAELATEGERFPDEQQCAGADRGVD